MSWLRFSRASRTIQLFAFDANDPLSPPAGSWDAHNETASNSQGPWPCGTFPWTHYNPHTDQPGFGPGCFSTAYGCLGIHVFEVPGRTGLGVHSGRVVLTRRDRVGGRTLGCIRVSEKAMSEINAAHLREPLSRIVVHP